MILEINIQYGTNSSIDLSLLYFIAPLYGSERRGMDRAKMDGNFDTLAVE
jgi:hypothetical protein